MSEIQCPTCGHKFVLIASSFPDCPECIKSRMKAPDGLTEKHESPPVPLTDNVSFIAAGVNPGNLFDYMSGDQHLDVSGCQTYYSQKHDSYNSISHKPCGEIPGSGVSSGMAHASEFAVLLDIKGDCAQGAHWMFMTQLEIDEKVASAEWALTPKCKSCGLYPVYSVGDDCFACTAGPP